MLLVAFFCDLHHRKYFNKFTWTKIYYADKIYDKY